MRSTLLTSIIVLGLVLALNSGPRRSPASELPGPAFAGRFETTGANVLIYSTAAGLVPEEYGTRRTPQAIIVDGDYYSHEPSQSGLRLLTLSRGRKVAAFRNYVLVGADADTELLIEHCRNAAVDTVLAMGLFQTLGPKTLNPTGSNEQLAELFTELGATSPPSGQTDASWAFITIKRPDGWIPLSEARSTTKGITLAYTIGGDLARYDGQYRPGVLVDRRIQRSLIDLFDRATHGPPPLTMVRRPSKDIGCCPLNGIFMHPLYGVWKKRAGEKINRVTWPEISIGHNARLETQLGLASRSRGKSDGVVFKVIVNGEIVAQRPIGFHPYEPDAWLPWRVDLSRYAGRTVALELAVGPRRNVDSDHAIWGDPKIVSEPARRP